MSKLRLSAESSRFYRQIKAKKYLHSAVSAHDSSASDQESNVSGDSEPKDDFDGFSPQVPRTNTQSKIQSMSISAQENAAELNNPEDGKLQPKHSFTRKPATRPAAEKKNQEPASLSKITDKKTKPPATKRGKKEAGNPTDNAAEPAAKRPRVASKRKAILTEKAATASTEDADDDPTLHENKGRGRGRPRKAILTKEAATASTEDADDDPTLHEKKGRGRPRGRPERDVSAEFVPETSSSSPSKSLDDQSRMEAKTPEAVNDEAHEMILKTAKKPKDSTLRENKGRGRPRGRPERDVSAEFVPETSSSSPSKSLDDQSRMEAKTPEAVNDEAHEMILKTAKKPKDSTLRENKGRGRPRGRPERDVSAEFVPETSSSSPSKSLDDQSRMEAKTPEAVNDEAHEMILKTAKKPKDSTLRENKGRGGRGRGLPERDVSPEWVPGTRSRSPTKSLDISQKQNLRGNKVSSIVDEVETDISAGGSKSKPPKSADPTLRVDNEQGRGRGRGRGRPERDLSAECIPGTSSSSPTKSLDDQSRVQVKTPEAHAMVLKTAEKPKERNYHFLSSSESEIEDEEDDEDDLFLLSRYSFQKTKSPKNAVPLPSFKTPNTVTDKVSELGSPKTSKFRLLPEPTPLLRTTPRRTTLTMELSLNRVEPSLSDPEDVADTELYKTSQQENQLEPSTSQANGKSIEETPVSKRRSISDSSKKPSPTKRLQSPLKSSQQPNDPENDIVGNDSRLIARKIEALQETMLRIENSMNRQVPLNSAIDPSTLPVPNRNLLPTQFNLYLASPSDPVRAQGLSNTEYSISLVYVQPTIVHPLKINNPMMVVRLKGSVEFRSDPHAPSHILLNSSTRLVDLEAGRTLHVVNTGEEVASFALLEIF
ncbi:serine/arginine repetitive matrix protein 2-like isoform X4 [Daphnia pulex]|uniref:serine/arginine repetitive matrix protein 2-like isoform X4 n=1 Tax=Daphnia pulex TaxID=6669 RepID=UPI001EDCE472|nr:serine/arginine repetitive matrix protein 2-like isoform X4 [Daphnia pulex]